MEPAVSSVPELVRFARRAAGLDQRALAAAAGTSTGTVGRLETGRPSTTAVLERVLAACGFRLGIEPGTGSDGEHELAARALVALHPLDRLTDALAGLDAAAGVPPAALVQAIGDAAWVDGWLVVGALARRWWGTDDGPIDSVQLVQTVPAAWAPRLAAARMQVVDLAAAGLPPHAARTSLLVDPWGRQGLRLAHPRDLGAASPDPRLSAAARALDALADRSVTGARLGAHRDPGLHDRGERSMWPSYMVRPDYPPAPEWAWRRPAGPTP